MIFQDTSEYKEEFSKLFPESQGSAKDRAFMKHADLRDLCHNQEEEVFVSVVVTHGFFVDECGTGNVESRGGWCKYCSVTSLQATSDSGEIQILLDAYDRHISQQ